MHAGGSSTLRCAGGGHGEPLLGDAVAVEIVGHGLGAGGALAVDMESVWLAAGAAGRPFAVVRVVLDSPSHELLRPGAPLGAVRTARALRRAAATALQSWRPEGLR